MKTSSLNKSRVLAMMLLLLSSRLAMATSYVSLTDGRLLVFPDSCVESKSTANGQLSFTAVDGTVFTFPLTEVASIGSKQTELLPTIESFSFKSKDNDQLFSDATGVIDGNTITVDVAGIGKWLTASFTLSSSEARAYVNSQEQVSRQTRLRFDSTLVYTVGYPGNYILEPQPSGGYELVPFGAKYNITVNYLTDQATAVPRIDINTVGGVNITSKKNYVDAQIIIDGARVFPSMTDSVKIRGRGNTSWSSDPNAKNPYRLKFADKVKPLGMKKGKNWVLLANKLKGSMLTNAIGMKAASLMGAVAANHIIPVDLYINGTYKGSYNFTEKVGLANNSVELDDETVAALLELDTYYDEPAGQKFRSSPLSLPVNIKEPEFAEGTTQLTLNDIKQRFNAFVSAVVSEEDITSHVEVEELAHYLLLNYFICNLELYHPKSTYCYYENVLDEESKLRFGPAWDLDWAFGYDGSHGESYFRDNINCNYFLILTSSNIFTRMKGNQQVANRMYELLRDFIAGGLDELCDYCTDYVSYAQPSLDSNKAAGLDNTDYAQQAASAAQWLRQRADYVRSELLALYDAPGDVNNDKEVNIGDVTALTDIILGGDPDASTHQRADVNNDGEITIADIGQLLELIAKD